MHFYFGKWTGSIFMFLHSMEARLQRLLVPSPSFAKAFILRDESDSNYSTSFLWLILNLGVSS